MPSNIYRKAGSKVWYLRVTVRGRERRESLQTTDRKIAAKRCAERLEAISRERWGDQRHAWQAAVIEWHKDAAATLKPQTVRRYLASIAAVSDILEPLHLDEIDRKVLARIAGRPHVTNATRRRDLTAISVVMHAAEQRGWIESVPVYSRRHIRERRDPIVLPTAAEVAKLHAILPPMLSRLCRLLEQTGLRLEEAGGLEWPQVDLRRATITLTTTKAGKVRTVPLSPDGVGTLSGTSRHLGCPFVFWHSQEAPKRYGDLSGLLYDYRKRAGVPWNIHALRHLFAVRYLKGGNSLYDLQKILGHSTIAVTEIYLDHLTPDEQAVAKRTAG